jgi:hypothetical protein
MMLIMISERMILAGRCIKAQDLHRILRPATQAYYALELNKHMRNFIRLVEAMEKGCPVATHDIELNLKNRQAAIDDYHYGPANPLEPGDYWKKAAGRWSVTEKTVKTMLCGNCAAFDASDSMRKCIESGIRGDDSHVDAAATINLSDLGYCNFLHFKCAGTRTCAAWVVGGPITEKDRGKKVM